MSPTTAPQPSMDRTSPALAVTGLLMLVALFLNANPSFGRARMWPWELFDLGMASAFVQGEILLWAFAGLWALLMAFSGAARLRSTVAAGLALTFLLQSARADSGLRIEKFFLNDMVALVGMGAGLLIVARPATRRLGRLICGASAVAFILAFLVGFDGPDLTPRYVLVFSDVHAALTGGEYSSARFAYVWYYLVPQVVLFGAAGCCLLVAFGGLWRKFLIAAFLVLVLGMIAPIPVRVIGVLTGGDPDVALVSGAFFVALIGDGGLVWLFATTALADLAAGREVAS